MNARALAVSVLSFATLATAADRPTVTKDNVASFYRAFKRLTPQPRVVMGDLPLLCRDVSAEMKQIRDTHGPHASHSINIYADATAASRWSDGAKPYPAGSVIVKEKLLGDRKTVSGVGGMIKRAKGYDPEHGDWEFFYWDKELGFSSGKLARCAECHAKAKASDFVYSRADLKPPTGP